MGATTSLSQLIWMANAISGDQYLAITQITGALFLLLQQCVITINFMCTNEMSHLCKLHQMPTNEHTHVCTCTATAGALILKA